MENFKIIAILKKNVANKYDKNKNVEKKTKMAPNNCIFTHYY